MSSWSKNARAAIVAWTKNVEQGHGCSEESIEGWGEDPWGDGPWGSEE